MSSISYVFFRQIEIEHDPSQRKIVRFAEWKNGLAIVLMGGLTSSLIFTVVLVPVMFVFVDTLKDKWGGKKEDKAKKYLGEEDEKVEEPVLAEHQLVTH